MIKYDHLIGRPFKLGSTDCYGLARDFYRDNFGIELRNFARPTNFWDHGLNLYMDNIYSEGFRPLNCHPREYQTGDCFLMNIRSPIVNHVGILLPDGQMLHHLYGNLSTVTPYRDLFRNTTMAVVRHKDVDLTKTEVHSEVDLMELLPDGIRRRLAEALPDRFGPGAGGVRPQDG